MKFKKTSAVLLLLASIVFVLAACGEQWPKDLIDLPEAEYKAAAQEFTYDDIARYPANYNGRLAKFTGKVVQVVRGDEILQLRVNVTEQGEYIAYYTDTVFVFYRITSGMNVLEGDIITMFGELRGTHSYTSVLNVKITIPKIYVKFIDIHNQ